jgi:hypothetical protein
LPGSNRAAIHLLSGHAASNSGILSRLTMMERAWEIQNKIDDEILHFKLWLDKKIGLIFLVGLSGMSMMAYGFVSLFWYDIGDLFYSNKIYFFANPILHLLAGFIAFIYAILYFINKKRDT